MVISRDAFGDRMKAYEAQEAERRFIPLLPVYARIDGRSFSRFTHGMGRPYDLRLACAMIETTKHLIAETHARIGYTQSDEINLVWLQERYDSEMFFGGKICKMTSILASMASAFFNQRCLRDGELQGAAAKHVPHFDCRVFQLPNLTEAANVFLWREKDATKNAISMAARSFCSHRALDGKNGAEMQEMIFQKGRNFNDYPAFFKRGTFVRRIVTERQFTDAEYERIPEKHRPPREQIVTRSAVVELQMPVFTTVTNREAVIFDGAEPVIVGEPAHPEPRDPTTSGA